MKKTIAYIIILIAFVGVADAASKTKPNVKKTELRMRCKPGYMFERGKCVIIPNMDDNPNKR